MRPCGHVFHVSTDVRTPPCSCGRESLAECVDCGAHLCGLHGGGPGEPLCDACRQKRLAQTQMREDEAARDHDRGLVDVGELPGLVDAGGRLQLSVLWDAVLKGLEERNAPTDIVVLDDLRLDDLPSRWPRTQGWMSGRSKAKWESVVDRLAVPAWDTQRGLRSGGGVADTFSIDTSPLYLGHNGVLYSGPANPTPNGTHAGWSASYRSAGDVDEAWTAKWMPYGTYYPRQEVAEALANLMQIHALNGKA